MVICSRDADRVADAAKKIGNGCVGIVGDVSTTEGALAFIREAKTILGDIDIVIEAYSQKLSTIYKKQLTSTEG